MRGVRTWSSLFIYSAVALTVGAATSKTPSLVVSQGVHEKCSCDVDESGIAKEWAQKLWIDLVIILDVSQAMGDSGVLEMTSLISSFVSRMNLDDKSSLQYSRVGLVTSSVWPKIIFNFNMTSEADLSSIKSEPYLDFNFNEAFKAAQHLFTRTPSQLHRSHVPRIINLITNTLPPTSVPAADQFKQDGGTIVISDFIQEGAVEQPNLSSLASPQFFFTDLTEDYNKNLQVFCQINCFCPGLKRTSIRTNTSNTFSGCYHRMDDSAAFDQAIEMCSKINLGLATIYNEEDESNLIKVKGLPHWFGLRLDDNIESRWIDQGVHSYTNWAANEPEVDNFQSCAYALKSTDNKIEWFAGDCHLPLHYACDGPPCSADRFCFGNY